MTVYVKAVLENTEIFKYERTEEYEMTQFEVCEDLNGCLLDLDEIENISEIEQKLYAFLKNQDINLLTSSEKYTTALVNYPHYKAINLENYLLKRENSVERLFSLAHELGHFLDMKFNHNMDADRFQYVYSNHMNKMEVVAWAYGWKVLESLGCTMKQEFMKLAHECLSSYIGSSQKALVVLQNMDVVVEEYEKIFKC